MHLTNYAINKHNKNFVRDDAMGSKRYYPSLFSCFLCCLALQLSVLMNWADSWEADCPGPLSLYRPRSHV